MDLSSPTLTTSSPLTPVFGDNVQDLLGTGALHVNPSAIITVNSIADTVDEPSSGVITLRDAINQANADNRQDLIIFDRSVFSTAQTITLSGTELDITHNLDIITPRDPLTGGDLVTVSGNKASRVFEIETGATVSIDGLIIADGNTTGNDGGGIKNSGTLILDSSTISNNSAFYSSFVNDNGFIIGGDGGGIYNIGTMTVSSSTISGNSGTDLGANKGAGIYNSGTMTVNSSTISGNKGLGLNTIGYGGGIYNSGTMTVNSSTINSNSTTGPRGGFGGGINNAGNLVVSNSTISGNTANRGGGGINNGGSLTLLFSTVTLNVSGEGGGVLIGSDSTNVRNTIIASNFGGDAFNVDYDSAFGSTFTSLGYNLIGNSTYSKGFGATGDIIGTGDRPIDPRLAPLDFNGGPTQTISLLPDSPAIGAGDPIILDTDPTTDQRGLPRVSNGRADIGAFEVQV